MGSGDHHWAKHRLALASSRSGRRHRFAPLVALTVLACVACGGRSSRDRAAGGGSGAAGNRQEQGGNESQAGSGAGGQNGDRPCDGRSAGKLTSARTFVLDTIGSAPTPRSRSAAPVGLVRCGTELCLAGELTGRLRLDQDLVSQGEQDAYLAKLTRDGTPVWSRRLGGTTSTDQVVVTSIAAGPDGGLALSVACTGQFAIAAADGGEASLDCDGSGSRVYLLRLDALGRLLWSVELGSSWVVPPLASVAIDASDRTVVAAYLGDTIRTAGKDPERALVAAFSRDGTWLFRHTFGGVTSQPSALAIDSAGNAVLTGFFQHVTSFDGDVPPASPTRLDGSSSSICVLKLDVTGALTWNRCFAGMNQRALGPELALGPDDSIALAGTFVGDLDFSVVEEGGTPSERRLSSVDGSSDAYVAKFDATGALLWQRQLGAADAQQIYHVTVTQEGYVLTAGVTWSSFSIDGFQLTSAGSSPFIAGFGSDGDAYFLTQLGPSAYLWGSRSIASGDCRTLYLAADYRGDLLAPGRPQNPALGLTLVVGQY